jgi:hypothetical protein
VQRHALDLVGHKLPGDCLIRIAIDPRPTATVPAPAPPTNCFVCRGNVWEIGFLGRPEILIQKHLKGCAYLQVLLQNPKHQYSIAELLAASGVATCDAVLGGQVSNEDLKGGFGISMGIPLTAAGDTFDRKALENIRAKAGGAPNEELDEAKTLGNETDQARIEGEIDAIAAHTKRSDGERWSRPRKVHDSEKTSAGRRAQQSSPGRLAEISASTRPFWARTCGRPFKSRGDFGLFPEGQRKSGLFRRAGSLRRLEGPLRGK